MQFKISELPIGVTLPGTVRFPGSDDTDTKTYTTDQIRDYVLAAFSAGGDLDGVLSGVTVVGLRGRSVASTAPTGGQVLQWNAATAEWIPASLSSLAITGDIGGTIGAATVNKIQGSPISSTAPTIGQILKWDGTNWTPSAEAATSLAGDVTGAPGTNTVAKIQGRAVSSAAPSTGQALRWDGTAWLPAADNAVTLAGDVTGDNSTTSVVRIQGRSVAATAPMPGQAIRWNGTAWAPASDASITLAGDASGAVGSVTVTRIQGRNVSSSAPSSGWSLRWSGTAWTPSADPTLILSGDVTGNSFENVVTALRGRTVSNTAPTNNQVLRWNNTALQWQPSNETAVTSVSVGGDLNGTSGTATVVGLQGRTVSATAPTINQILRWNGTSWVPSTETATTSVTMGGDVTGGSASSTVVALRGRLLSTTAPSNNQVLRWNSAGSEWVPSNETTISSLSVGGDLSGSTASAAVIALRGYSITTGVPETGQFLVYDGTKYNLVNSLTVGGDLTGTNAAATVSKLQGTSLTVATPVTGRPLFFDGTSWKQFQTMTLMMSGENGRVGAGFSTTTGLHSTLHSIGSMAANVAVASTATTIDETKFCLVHTGGAVTFTLPSASSSTGRYYWIMNHGTSNITLNPAVKKSSGGTFNVVQPSYMALIISDGTDWRGGAIIV